MPLRWFCLLALFTLAGCSHGIPSEPIVVGHLASVGSNSESQGLSLGLATLMDDPTLRPLGRQVRILEAPLGSTPEQAVGQAVFLASMNKIGVIFCDTFPSGIGPLTTSAESDGFLLFADQGPGGNLATNHFTFRSSLESRGEALARYAEEKHLEKIAVLRPPSTKNSQSGFEAFRKSLKAAQICEFEITTNTDWGKVGRELSTGKFTAVLVVGSIENLITWQKHTDHGIEGIPLLYLGEEMEVAERALNFSVTIATDFAVDPEIPATTTFAAKYRETYGMQPPPRAAVSYEKIVVFGEAARRAESVEPARLRAELTKKDASFTGLAGSLWFGDDRSIKRTIFIAETDGLSQTSKARYSP